LTANIIKNEKKESTVRCVAETTTAALYYK